jgi:hypothetical protein
MIIKTKKVGGRGKSGTRKYGRNLDTCKRYRDRGQREKNKARRLEQRERKFEKRRKNREVNING